MTEGRKKERNESQTGRNGNGHLETRRKGIKELEREIQEETRSRGTKINDRQEGGKKLNQTNNDTKKVRIKTDRKRKGYRN